MALVLPCLSAAQATEVVQSPECQRIRTEAASAQSKVRVAQRALEPVKRQVDICEQVDSGRMWADMPAATRKNLRQVSCEHVDLLQERVRKASVAAAEVEQQVQRCDDEEAPQREKLAAAERARLEAEADKVRASNARAEAAFNASLARATPQALYLMGGRFEREGLRARATQVYNFLLDKHAETNWAVKANDRLLQLDKDQERESARSRCLAEKASCERNCDLIISDALRLTCNAGCSKSCN